MKPNEISVGERVFTRNHPKGRCKIQNKWKNKVYKVIRKQNDVYEIEPADGNGPSEVVNRAELQVCPKPKKQTQNFKTMTHEISGEGSSDEGEGVLITIPGREPVRNEPCDEQRPLCHRSQRRGKGQHTNPYHQPRSATS